jgi:anti-anti-sigma factor
MRPDDTLPLTDPPERGPHVSVGRDGPQVVVTLRGEIDASNADAIPDLVVHAAEGCTSVRVDISDVTFLDSTLLRALLICQTRLVIAGVDFKVRSPSPQARRTFELTHLESMLE